jgi:hypothetical protein
VIELNPDIVRIIAGKAREYQMKDAMEGAEREQEPEDSSDGLSELEQSPDTGDYTYQELVNAINDLEPDQQVCLVALMWLGRGDYDIEEWDVAMEEAAQAYNNRTAQYVASTPLAADYLEEGLRAHDYDEG